MPFPENITTTVTTDLTWLQKHERILIAVLIAAVVVFALYKWSSYAAKVADERLAVAAQVAADAKLAATAAATNSQQIQSQYAAMVDALTRQNAALASAVAARNSGLVKQQATDRTLSPTEVTQRWATLVPGVHPTATATGASVTTAEAQNTVAQLEQIPVLVANTVDARSVAENVQLELEKSNQVSTALRDQIGILNTEITDNDKVCKAAVADVKAKARKSKFKWFGAGFVTGFVSGIWAGHTVGL